VTEAGTTGVSARPSPGSNKSKPARRLSGIGWLTAASVAAVIAINVAGIGAIAVARRAAVEEAGKALALETSARARSIESILASTRADLAFLTGSPTLFGLESALGSRDPREARWRRLEAEGALLIFLRGHPEVARLVARSERGAPLVEAGRRGGVPVLWMSGGSRTATEGVDGGLTGEFAFTTGTRRVSGAVTLEATIDAAKLFDQGPSPENSSRACLLADAKGAVLALLPEGKEEMVAALWTPAEGGGMADGGGADAGWLRAEASVRTESWSAPSPWRLTCARRRGPVLALLEPVAVRYRTTLLLNLAVMSLALLLGAFAIQQGRKRQRLEALAREEARVRDLERRLFHAERLSTVGRLAAGMAHEINNPLEGIVNYLGLAREDLSRGDAAAAQRRLDGVQEGVRRAVAIVRQVLAYADPATAPMVSLDLNEVLLASAEFVRSRPEFGNIRFHLMLSGRPLPARGSQALLGQVFLNLLLNACESQPEGGEVSLSTRREAGRAVAEIADRGPGVPRVDSARIFAPFYSTKRSTGLGLSICHSIVAQHGGELRVGDREGGGAVFTLVLPGGEEPGTGPGGAGSAA
jgi:signal transduction histidine kinase